MGIKKFTDFESRTQLLSGDYVVGYKEDGSAEYKVPISQLLTRSDLSQTSFGTGSAIGEFSHAVGQETVALGVGSYAEGGFTYSEGDYSHAEGLYTSAYGWYSHAEGRETAAIGLQSHAAGFKSVARGDSSFAQGRLCEAVGDKSYALGDRATAVHNRSWIWHVPPSDFSTVVALSTTRPGQFMVNAPGGAYFRTSRFGIGTDSIDYALTVIGDISATGIIYANKGLTPNLPVPRIALRGITAIEYLSSGGSNNFGVKGNITLDTTPLLNVSDFTQEQLDNYQIFIEMVIFKKSKKSPSDGKVGRYGYVVSTGSTPKPWGNFWQRSGISSMQADPSAPFTRTNHIPVTALNETINLSQCLNAHFRERDVLYLDPTSVDENDLKVLTCITPFSPKALLLSSPIGSNRRQLGYSRMYKPLHIAFRYICWLPENNNGLGQIISGPLSPTIRVANKYFAFDKNITQTALKGYPVVDVNPLFNKELFTCKFAR